MNPSLCVFLLTDKIKLSYINLLHLLACDFNTCRWLASFLSNYSERQRGYHNMSRMSTFEIHSKIYLLSFLSFCFRRKKEKINDIKLLDHVRTPCKS